VSQTIVIFGASGDLTSRKLIPALYELQRKKRLPPGTQIVGVARTKYSDDAWRAELQESTAKFVGAKFDPDVWQAFAGLIHYHPGDIGREEDFAALRGYLDQLESGAAASRIYYLSTAPQFYEPAIGRLGAAGLVGEELAPRRVVIEKPFGTDLKTARQLNRKMHEVLAEHQVYRIDHYLGKETVQNVLVLRFANAIFEPIWNRNYIEHVQITAAEDLAVGHRAAYYDTAGILRDMFQNHLLQLLMVAAMEAPARFESASIRDEKVKVLKAIRPLARENVAAETIRAQYRTYRDEPGVRPGSTTATFGVVRLHVDNWRWQGVPFYLRSGKAMSCPTTQIVIQFRQPPHMLFGGTPKGMCEANRLVIQIQPGEGIQLHFQTKVPDAGMQLRLTDLSFLFRQEYSDGMPEAYQRLLLDVMHGDASLFARSDEVELAWSIIDPIQAAWDDDQQPALGYYEAGEWGPATSLEWMERQGRHWFDYCPVIR